jgi:hypothetical protein
MSAIREDMAMAFFKRELSPVERFESALKDKQAARQKLADRLSIAETVLGEKRVAAERLAVAGATNAQLDRAEAKPSLSRRSEFFAMHRIAFGLDHFPFGDLPTFR